MGVDHHNAASQPAAAFPLGDVKFRRIFTECAAVIRIVSRLIIRIAQRRQGIKIPTDKILPDTQQGVDFAFQPIHRERFRRIGIVESSAEIIGIKDGGGAGMGQDKGIGQRQIIDDWIMGTGVGTEHVVVVHEGGYIDPIAVERIEPGAVQSADVVATVIAHLLQSVEQREIEAGHRAAAAEIGIHLVDPALDLPGAAPVLAHVIAVGHARFVDPGRQESRVGALGKIKAESIEAEGAGQPFPPGFQAVEGRGIVVAEIVAEVGIMILIGDVVMPGLIGRMVIAVILGKAVAGGGQVGIAVYFQLAAHLIIIAALVDVGIVPKLHDHKIAHPAPVGGVEFELQPAPGMVDVKLIHIPHPVHLPFHHPTGQVDKKSIEGPAVPVADVPFVPMGLPVGVHPAAVGKPGANGIVALPVIIAGLTVIILIAAQLHIITPRRRAFVDVEIFVVGHHRPPGAGQDIIFQERIVFRITAEDVVKHDIAHRLHSGAVGRLNRRRQFRTAAEAGLHRAVLIELAGIEMVGNPISHIISPAESLEGRGEPEHIHPGISQFRAFRRQGIPPGASGGHIPIKPLEQHRILSRGRQHQQGPQGQDYRE